VDGIVVAGHSFVDQATITGESMPVEKVSGSRVFAGTLNQSGVLEIRADRIGRTPPSVASSS
jgi:P-type Cu+ transporter